MALSPTSVRSPLPDGGDRVTVLFGRAGSWTGETAPNGFLSDADIASLADAAQAANDEILSDADIAALVAAAEDRR